MIDLKSRAAAELAKLATNLADIAAESLIESLFVPVTIDDERWFDAKCELDEQEAEVTKHSLRYLELRGKLWRHPESRNLVRVAAVKP